MTSTPISHSEDREPYILVALRSPIGRYRGGLKDLRADDLLAQVLTAVVERAGLAGSPQLDQLADVIIGCANQAGEDNRNVARMALLLAGLPQRVSGVTVNRLCGSGLEAVLQAARAIRAGEGELFIAGGVESMTRAPLVLGKPELGFGGGNQTLFDSSLGWRFPNPKLAQQFPLEAMGETAENLVERYQIGRDEQDQLALRSHQRALAAQAAGRFAAELLPIRLPPAAKGQPAPLFAVDEGPRSDTSLEKLGKLGPAFRPGGSVTAGNSSTLNDGAAALLIGTRAQARRLGLPLLARIVGGATAGVDPRYMGIGPVPAIRQLQSRLAAAGQPVDLATIDRFELNEAFAAQVLADLRELPELSPALVAERLNVNGGAIALGHPLGCSGARIVTSLVHELGRLPVQTGRPRLGLVAMCIGVGQGIAALFATPDSAAQ
jgi:acetyl-CoA C-acetyltransferase